MIIFTNNQWPFPALAIAPIPFMKWIEMAITARMLFHPSKSREPSPNHHHHHHPRGSPKNSTEPRKSSLISDVLKNNHQNSSHHSQPQNGLHLNPRSTSDPIDQPHSSSTLDPYDPATRKFPPENIPMMDDSDLNESVPPPQVDPMLQLDPEYVPLLQQQLQPHFPHQTQQFQERDRQSSPFLLPVRDLTSLPLGNDYGWKIEDWWDCLISWWHNRSPGVVSCDVIA